MIEKLSDFYSNLDLKNKVYLYISVLITFAVLFYFVNYYILFNKISSLDEIISHKQEKLEKIKRDKNIAIKKISKVKKEYKIILQKVSELKEDLKYLKYKIYFSDKLFINDKKFYSIIETLLKNSSSYYLPNNYVVLKAKEFNLTKYNLTIYGNTFCKNYNNLLKFLIMLEKLNYIKNINEVNLTFNKDLNYSLKINFWSFK